MWKCITNSHNIQTQDNETSYKNYIRSFKALCLSKWRLLDSPSPLFLYFTPYHHLTWQLHHRAVVAEEMLRQCRVYRNLCRVSRFFTRWFHHRLHRVACRWRRSSPTTRRVFAPCSTTWICSNRLTSLKTTLLISLKLVAPTLTSHYAKPAPLVVSNLLRRRLIDFLLLYFCF